MSNCRNIGTGCNGQTSISDEHQEIKSSTNLAEAIKIATDRKKLPHPRRITEPKLKELENELLKLELEIGKVQNFHELIIIVRKGKNEGKIKGIGALTIYDVAELIGRFLKLYPEMVYLHSGTGVGAKIFFGGKFKDVVEVLDGFPVIRKDHFPRKFEKYTCDDLESLLCMKKGRLDEI